MPDRTSVFEHKPVFHEIEYESLKIIKCNNEVGFQHYRVLKMCKLFPISVEDVAA